MAADATRLRIGTAGWSIPAACRPLFPGDSPLLERYATRLNAAEINTSFYRTHRRSTYEKWASLVPDDFSFSVKLPREITHMRRFKDCAEPAARFADEVSGLGHKLGVVLVQLPPSLPFETRDAAQVFGQLAAALSARIVCEPRHASWFGEESARFLRDHSVARVAADPESVPGAAEPGGFREIAYFRLHGSPRMYYSGYDAERLEHYSAQIDRLLQEAQTVWCIFDNTAEFAALPNALSLMALRAIPAG